MSGKSSSIHSESVSCIRTVKSRFTVRYIKKERREKSDKGKERRRNFNTIIAYIYSFRSRVPFQTKVMN